MSFGTIPFVFVFLPGALILYWICPKKLRPALLVVTGLVFYAWGDVKHIPVLLFSILFNYLSGLEIAARQALDQPKRARAAMWVAVAVNVLVLCRFKYLSGAFPIGLSFYTFSALSYVLDIYMGKAEAERDPIRAGAYIAFFPKLISGPIVRYADFRGQLGGGRISRAEALERCQNLGRVVIKPTQEGMWGEGVKVFSVEQGIVEEGLSIEQLFEKYGKNFIIQEAVAQHPEMAKLNPTSLNTLRVLSYRQGDEVFILYAVVRIGRAGKSVDNETAGGINAAIDLATGTIRDCAYGTPSEKRILTTDVGTTLKGFAIPSFQQVLETVKDMHLRLPYFNLIGWDFGIDENGLPVMIEWNRAPDLSQTAHGPAFGEMTESIFERIRHLKNTMLR